jgi:hypothetical protein
MDSTKSVKVIFSLWKYGSSLPHPREIETPDGVVDERWIPQSMADSTWRVFEFSSAEMRDVFVRKPPAAMMAAIMVTPDQDFYNKWCK